MHDVVMLRGVTGQHHLSSFDFLNFPPPPTNAIPLATARRHPTAGGWRLAAGCERDHEQC